MIQKLFVDFNSPVRDGQVIAQIDPATYQAAVHQAEGDLANSKAALELAQINADRANRLRAQNLAPQSDLDTALANLDQAKASVKIKEAVLEKAKVDLDRCTILAPIDGVVISRNVDVGQTVAASLSAPTVFVIANDLTKMQIDANVAEADVGGLEVGQEVDFTVDAFPYRKFQAKVTQIRFAPITIQNVVTYDTVLGVSNPELKLRPGMTANVSIIVAHRDNALKIPNAALRFRLPESLQPAKPATSPATQAPPASEQKVGTASSRGTREKQSTRTIYILSSGENEKPRPVQIKTGISDGFYTEVLEGLDEQTRVVTGMSSSQAASSAVNNPFSGGARRF